MTTLSELISSYIKENRLSQREFALLADISHTYVAKLVTGIDPRSGRPIEPTLSVIEKLSTAMNLTLEELLIKLGKIGNVNKQAESVKSQASINNEAALIRKVKAITLKSEFIDALKKLGKIKNSKELTPLLAMKLLQEMFEDDKRGSN